jgi:hypothetical protein
MIDGCGLGWPQPEPRTRYGQERPGCDEGLAQDPARPQAPAATARRSPQRRRYPRPARPGAASRLPADADRHPEPLYSGGGLEHDFCCRSNCDPHHVPTDQMKRRRTIASQGRSATQLVGGCCGDRTLRGGHAAGLSWRESRALEERSVDYHLGVLQLCRITKPIKRAVSASAAAHQSNVAEDRWVRAQLTATKAKDEAAARRPNRKHPRKSI